MSYAKDLLNVWTRCPIKLLSFLININSMSNNNLAAASQ